MASLFFGRHPCNRRARQSSPSRRGRPCSQKRGIAVLILSTQVGFWKLVSEFLYYSSGGVVAIERRGDDVALSVVQRGIRQQAPELHEG